MNQIESKRKGRERRRERNQTHRRNSRRSLDGSQFLSDVDLTVVLGLATSSVSDDGGVA